jgi:hypothetical protein
VLDETVAGGAMALAALALNAWLMLAWIDAYKPLLQRRALAAFEQAGDGRNYDRLYAIPRGGVTPAQFGGAVVVLALVAAFYHFVVTGGTALYALLTLAWPALVLLARLAQGLGRGGPATPEPA